MRTLRDIVDGTEPRTCIYVAMGDEGDVVGVSMGEPTGYPQFAEAPERTGEIGCLYVLPEHERRGHGRRLIQATAAHLARQGMTALLIRCLKTNAPARGFYEAMGGHAVGEVEWEEYGHTGQEVVYLWPDTRSLVAGERARAGSGRDKT
jgi:ribosomal protein S18 acetylase RimI-like enzyme